uniref:F-box domain-containing protein n=1 Tax=Heterorhabditis bacteriophora TaxID=37862 RepID=A0A1I7XLQ0_HETBA
METLNIDCLSQIFLNLDFVERVRLEQVCPMFYYVLQHRSAFSDNAKLDISKFLINTTAEYYQQIYQYYLTELLLNLKTSHWKRPVGWKSNVDKKYLEIGGAHSFPSEVFLDFLQEQKNLEEFDAAPIPVLDEDIIVALGQLPKLYHLSIGYSYNADLRFDPLSGLTTLKSLKLQTVAGITEMSLRLILSFMHHLESLSISNCGNILDYSSLELCTNIHTLEIKDTMQLANEDIFTLCTYGKLKRLVLSNCFNLSTRGVNTALMRCQLKELTVNKCSRVTDEMMYTLASTQRELEMISIQGCSSITRYKTTYALTLKRVYRRFLIKCYLCSLQRLVMYIFDTSVSIHLEYEVNNLILLRLVHTDIEKIKFEYPKLALREPSLV